jgi:tetraacyldisaccharide 4'-kinase
VVSVGNLAVGGTGKTPVAAWVARTLADMGARPALLARGYGRDELLLHARWNADVPVLSGSDRVESARHARESGHDVAVLDDGFQHLRLARDIDLVLLAAEDPFPGRLLPRGPYREPVRALARADGVVVTRRVAPARAALELADAVGRMFPDVTTATLHLALAEWRTLGGEASSAPEGPILAVAGIARPEDFASQLSATLAEPVELAGYPDHHEYSARDIDALAARAKGATVVTTEKDAVKLQAYGDRLPAVRVLTQELRWESGEPDIRNLLSSILQAEA